MRHVKRTAVIVIPKQPYIDWANSMDDSGVKLREDFDLERTIYLVEGITGNCYPRCRRPLRPTPQQI